MAEPMSNERRAIFQEPSWIPPATDSDLGPVPVTYYVGRRSLPEPPALVARAPKGRVWFYRPEWWFDGWSPVVVSHDEYSRRTLVLGWPITGRIIIALGYCGDRECYQETLRILSEEDER